MKRPPLAYLLLLPLLAVLLFGNCGGGVNRFLYNLENRGRLAQFDSLVRQRQQLRGQARQQLRGQARRDALYSIEERTNAQLQPLLQGEWQRRKFENRRNKIERRLRKKPVPEKTLYLRR
ncbi:hypothetical protein [Hymenobacter daeguensis]